jgi:hypothetical protein
LTRPVYTPDPNPVPFGIVEAIPVAASTEASRTENTFLLLTGPIPANSVRSLFVFAPNGRGQRRCFLFREE